MADRKYPITFEFHDDEGAKKIREIREAMQGTVKGYDELNKKSTETLQSAAKNTKDYGKTVEEVNDTVQSSNKTTEKQNVLLEELGRQLKHRLNEVKIFGVGVGDLADRFKNALTGTNDMIKDLKRFKTSLNSTDIALSQGAKSAKGFAAATRVIKIALAGLGIGLVLIALGALVKLLSQSEKITNAVSDAMAGLQAAVKASGEFINRMGKAIVRFVNLDFAGVILETQKAQKAWNEDIVAGYDAASNYNEVLRETKELMDDLALNKGFNTLQSAVLDDTINDKAATYSQKLDAIIKKRKLLTDELDQQITAQERLVAAAVNQADYERDNAKAQDLRAQRVLVYIDAKNQIRRLDEEQLRAAEEINKEQERLTEQAEKEAIARQKSIEALQKMVDNYLKKIGDIDAESLSPLMKINRQEELAIKEMDAMMDEIKRMYLETYGEIIDLTATRENGINVIIAKYAKEREKIIAKSNGIIKNLEDKATQQRKEGIEKIIKDLQDALGNWDPETEESTDNFITKWLKKTFEIEDKDFNKFIYGVNTVIGEATDAWRSFYDSRIEDNQRLLDSIREQKEEYRALLDEEIEDAAAGYRNDVGNAKNRYQEILEAEKKAQKESIELRKKQIIAEAAIAQTQISLNLITAASNIISSSSLSGGIVGPIIAAIGIASILATFKKAKSQIDSIKLYEGGSTADAMIRSNKQDHGFVNKTQGRNDKYQRGHRVEDSNLELGGTEYVNRSDISLKYAEFLDRWHSGQLDHIDFNKIGRKTVKQYPLFNPRSSTMSAIRSHSYASSGLTKEDLKKVMVEVFPALFDKNGQMVSDTIKRKKGIAYKPDGTRVEYDDNRRVEVN